MMTIHLAGRGHKNGKIIADCGLSFKDLPLGDMIMIGKQSDWKGDPVVFCAQCVQIEGTIPESEKAK